MPNSSSLREPRNLRENNRSAVLGELLRHGATSRTELAARTGLTATAITRISRELIEAGLLYESGAQERNGQPGRRSVTLDFRAEGAYVIGIGIHASDHSVCLANLRGEVVEQIEIPARLLSSPTRTFEFVRDAVDSLLDGAAAGGRVVLGIAIAIAGVMDNERLSIESMPQRGWESFVLAPYFEHTQLPVTLDNVNNTLNLAEWRFGLSREFDNVLMLRVSSYVGASAICNGRLLRGLRARSMTLGHHSALRHPGADLAGLRRCECGRTGCANTVFSGQAIVGAVHDLSLEAVLADDLDMNARRLARIIEAAASGPGRERQALVDAGIAAAHVLDDMTQILDPDLIVIGGPVGQSPAFLAGIEERRLRADTLPPADEQPPVFVSTMSVAQATVYVALDQFAFSTRLNMGALTRPRKAARLRAEAGRP